MAFHWRRVGFVSGGWGWGGGNGKTEEIEVKLRGRNIIKKTATVDKVYFMNII